MILRDFEKWYPKISKILFKSECIDMSTPLPPAAATVTAVRGMHHMMDSYCRENKIPYPQMLPTHSGKEP